MKRLTFIACAITLIGCTGSADQRAVRDYLEEHGIVNYTDIAWGERDSVYSPFNVDLEASALKTSYMAEASRLEYEQGLVAKYSPEYNILHDSLLTYYKMIDEVETNKMLNHIEMHNNREGIPFSFSVNGTQYDMVFVFNNDGKTIGHALLCGRVYDF